jgi:transposase InsO family protein
MKRMGIEAIYRKPNTSKPEPGHKIYPYLLRKLPITRPNQVWAMDITYIPMARGFIYLAAVLDWLARRVLAWRVSITLEADVCIDAVEEALTKHGKPEIFNTDQGSQFTSTDFIKMLAAHEIKISMDRKGAWRDNVFVERLWRTIKSEEVYLRAYASVSEARAGIGRYLAFYNGRRPHSSLDGKPPIRPTSTSRYPRRWRRNQGGKPLTKRLETVQFSRTTSGHTTVGTFASIMTAKRRQGSSVRLTQACSLPRWMQMSPALSRCSWPSCIAKISPRWMTT